MQATQRIRKLWTKSELPVIGLTADFLATNLENYKSVGMNDCIGKPVRLAHLGDVISNVKSWSFAPSPTGTSNQLSTCSST
jgi:CheY-like chemotaxis protein